MYFEYLKRLFRKSYINILEYNAIGIIDFLLCISSFYILQYFSKSYIYINCLKFYSEIKTLKRDEYTDDCIFRKGGKEILLLLLFLFNFSTQGYWLLLHY